MVNKRTQPVRTIVPVMNLHDYTLREMEMFNTGCEWSRIMLALLFQTDYEEEVCGENISRIKDTFAVNDIAYTLTAIQVAAKTHWVLKILFTDEDH